MSLDGTDFRIAEPSPFDPKWYSHKFKAAGLRYEVGLSITTGKIVWQYGGFACGEMNDLMIARDKLVQFLIPNEKVLADKGYQDSRYFITPTDENGIRHKQIMSRHETVNKRYKQFEILNERFRHDNSKHSSVFYAIGNILSFVLEEEPLYNI